MSITNFLKTLFKTNTIKLTEVQERINTVPPNKNILIDSSCGSGKTEASYYIATLWGGRVMYSYPMKSLATSICNRLNDYEHTLGSNEKWTIQHSGANEDNFLKNNKCVTTIDQILSGYLGIGRQAFIKGKNVVRSNFIFDEIQLFDPEKTLKTLIYMLDALHKKNNRFVIMTATMPQVLIDFLAKRYDMEVIITDKPSVENRTVKLYHVKKLKFNIIDYYQKKQIIICNSQNEQDEILHNIKDKSRVVLLNNKLLQTDRVRVEAEVFKYFGKGTPENNKILITTQIVEAGMDISATKMYSSLAPIDNIIQREGRVCRWGGNGELIIFEGFYHVYDKDVCLYTLKKVKENQGLIFEWGIQKQWVNEILNPFYQKHLNGIKKFKFTMKDGNRDKLIRHIEAINIIVSDSKTKDDFNRESISVSRKTLEKLSYSNTLHVQKNGSVVQVQEFEVNNGDTVLIDGFDCIYDTIGFMYSEGGKSSPFPMSSNAKKGVVFEDYIEERWIDHALEVKNVMTEQLITEKFLPLNNDEIERISVISGLHDLGKLTVPFYNYIGSTNEPLAHNVFKPRNSNAIKDIKHNLVSALALRDSLTKLEFNLLLCHHGRIMPSGTNINIGYYDFVDEYEELINQIGYIGKVDKSGGNIGFIDKNLLTPIDDDWANFVYLEGCLMEADVEAIKRVKARKTP